MRRRRRRRSISGKLPQKWSKFGIFMEFYYFST